MMPGRTQVVWEAATWDGLKSWIEKRLGPRDRIGVLVEEGASYVLPVMEFWPGRPFIILAHPAGEAGKNWESLGALLRHMLRLGLNRKSALVVVGGGSLCDVGGLAAALFMRGIPCIYVPTTLLAMVDAALGGKTAVNLEGFKNMAGLFKDPLGVWCDVRFLHSLRPVHFLEGVAEMLKHGLVADENHFAALAELKDIQLLKDRPDLLQESQKIKLAITEQDPEEAGPRRVLNFGHTVGHALESHFMAKGRPEPHGVCVALGMAAETVLSVAYADLAEDAAQHVQKVLFRIFGSVLPKMPNPDHLIPYMLRDKKNQSGRIHCTLLRKIGQGVWNVGLEKQNIITALQPFDPS
ncbi:MAG: 3-dehydroquinate synthase [Flavobacteriales bacterium]|nr:3-dehydroquinate synthase [Flavobacteriales bacterium]MDW8431813.1 3-dehydroquinate synthase family protein [Flavobacteriales bacterium]